MKTTGLALTADVELDSDAVGGVAAGAAPVALVALARGRARGPSLRGSGRRCRLRAILRVVVGRLHPAEQRVPQRRLARRIARRAPSTLDTPGGAVTHAAQARNRDLAERVHATHPAELGGRRRELARFKF